MDLTGVLKRRAEEAELTNPLAGELGERHFLQMEDMDYYLKGIGNLVPHSGTVYSHEPGEPRQRPATDEEAKTGEVEWSLRLLIDLTDDISDQMADGLEKLARRFIRTSKRIRKAKAEGELSREITTGYEVVKTDGTIVGTTKTHDAAITLCMESKEATSIRELTGYLA